MPSTPDLSSSISQLKSRWIDLHDLDRAREIDKLRRKGASIQEIARGLGFSPCLLRHLLDGLKASATDLDLARRNLISTNELARRAKATEQRMNAERREALKSRQADGARRAADKICNWIAEQRINGPDGEWIVDKVNREFYSRMHDGSLPPRRLDLPRLPLQELIRRSKPKTPPDDNASNISWYKDWLCRWTFFAFPDPQVRDLALDLALEIQWKR